MSDIAAKLTAVADNIPKVYEAGKKSEYDRFWDAFQDNGYRGDYYNCFYGEQWDNITFKPKYNIVPSATTTSTQNMFRGCGVQGDLGQVLDDLGVILDFSKVKAMHYTFHGSSMTKLPVIDMSSVVTANHTFASALVETLHIVVGESTEFPNTFVSTKRLENLTVSGTIAKSLSFADSPLSAASMKSVISCLKNLTGTSEAGVNTITFNDACWTKLEADSTAPDGGTWRSYVENTLGWVT